MSDAVQGGAGQVQSENPVMGILNKVGQKVIMKDVISYLVMALAALLALVSFVNWCIRIADVRYLSGAEAVGYVFFMLGSLFGGALAFAVMGVRGWQMKGLPSSGFTMSPIVGHLAGMWGEMMFVFLAVLSFPATLAVWCGFETLPVRLLLAFNVSKYAAINGIVAFLAFLASAFAFYIFGRWVKEWTTIMVQTAEDTKAIRAR